MLGSQSETLVTRVEKYTDKRKDSDSCSRLNTGAFKYVTATGVKKCTSILTFILHVHKKVLYIVKNLACSIIHEGIL